MKKLLEGIKVFDFGWAMVGSYTTKMLADYGATVVKVESATHIDFMRTNGWLKGTDKNNPNDKPYASWMNTSKYDMALNTKNPLSKDIVEKFYKWADVVFENFSPGTLERMGYGYEWAKTINPNIIMCHASIYGNTGPLASQAGTDGIGSSAGAHRGMTGWPDRTPEPCSPMVTGDLMLPFVCTSSILAALDYRRRTGKGQELDCSMLDLITLKSSPQAMNLAANGVLEGRDGNHALYACPHAIYPCMGDDRWCAVACYEDADWEKLKKLMDNPSWADDPSFATLAGRKAKEDFIDEKISEWTKGFYAEELMGYLQQNGVAAGVAQNQGDVHDKDPVMAERYLYEPCEHKILGNILHQNSPFIFSETKSNMTAGAWLGEHTFKICSEFLGMSDDEFVKYDQEGVFI